MKTSLIRRVAEIVLLATLVIILSLVIFSLRGGREYSSTVTNLDLAQPYPSPEAAHPLYQDSYPPPTLRATPPPSPEPVTPTPVPAFPETPPLPAGRAATLFEGDIWLVEPGQAPSRLTDYGDVAAIFGWNPAGDHLLLGRGHKSRGDLSESTELWFFDLNDRQASQLTSNSLVLSASWSPVNNEIAYCEVGDILKVVTVEGNLLYQHERVSCSFTWSPDGSAIAVETYTPEMIASDAMKYSVLGVWRLRDDRLQVLRDEKDEGQFWPVWSTDMSKILFYRAIYNPDKKEENGLYIADVASGQFRYLDGTSISAEEMSRSPKANWVVFRIGKDIYIMDFNGQTQIIGNGTSMAWLPSGNNFSSPLSQYSKISQGYSDTHQAYDYLINSHDLVVAAKSGTVEASTWVYADGWSSDCQGFVRDRGNYIILEHGSNLETWYFHLSNTCNRPAVGATFSRGGYMALGDDTGCSTGHHLHFAVKLNGIPIDLYAGTTNRVSGSPIPMGFRDQNGTQLGSFSLDNTKIHDKWVGLEGAPGAPTEDDGTSPCPTFGNDPDGGLAATLYYQRFQWGEIEYCGMAAATYTAYPRTYLPEVSSAYASNYWGSVISTRSNVAGCNEISLNMLYSSVGRSLPQ
jgi:murein DD-endopeptidase MepM/ murein hydrolase activator NlpD